MVFQAAPLARDDITARSRVSKFHSIKFPGIIFDACVNKLKVVVSPCHVS